MSKNNYVLGVDYGTDSVRSILVNTSNGAIVQSAVHYYERWAKGLYCNPSINQYRQHPQDYVDGLIISIKACIKNLDKPIVENIVGLSIDTTGSTPIAVNKEGTPLALTAKHAENPNAMFVLWKDHTAAPEAKEINEHAKKYATNYLEFVGGIYSSEWYWAKLLHILRIDKTVEEDIYTWVEHCDWIPYLLTGEKDASKLKRSVCSAGHKALWAEKFDGYPPISFFSELDPKLEKLVASLSKETYSAAVSVGTITAQWAMELGIPATTAIGVGAFDAHMGAVGGQIEPYYLSKVMGTSTCDILVAPINEIEGKLIKGICGQVNGSVLPGMVGLEAGQSAFGDIYAWFKNILAWPLQNILLNTKIGNEIVNEAELSTLEEKILAQLNETASELPLNTNDPIALDWMNGRRTPDANQLLKGAIEGISLATSAPILYKSLVEATCFGAKAIVDRFIQEGIPIKGIIGLGGVAKKSPFIMQMMSDVMDMPIKIHKSEQTCALGAAMFAATAAGVYSKVEEAMEAMGQGFEITYYPNKDRVNYYKERYLKYIDFGKFIEQTTY
jgi:L-ribulokinase